MRYLARYFSESEDRGRFEVERNIDADDDDDAKNQVRALPNCKDAILYREVPLD